MISVVAITNDNAKASFLKGKVIPGDIVVGDSPIDMECASLLGITGFFVETGLWYEPNGPNFKVHASYNDVVESLLE